MEIKKENYEKFIQIAKHLIEEKATGSDQPALTEVFAFNLEAIARMVDIAFCEGQIAELTRDEDYAEDMDKVNRLGALQTQIENSLPEGFVEMV